MHHLLYILQFIYINIGEINDVLKEHRTLHLIKYATRTIIHMIGFKTWADLSSTISCIHSFTSIFSGIYQGWKFLVVKG